MAAANLVLVCKICRWRPPNDLEMNLVQAHFDIEPDHDPEDLWMELVALCPRCDLEMPIDRSEARHDGTTVHHYTCNGCRRSWTVTQRSR